MAVPAHDARDFEFAKTFNLPIRQVVSLNDGKEWDQEKAYAGDGELVNSSYEIDINGLSTSEAASKVIQWLEQNGSGKKQVRGLVGWSACSYRAQLSMMISSVDTGT